MRTTDYDKYEICSAQFGWHIIIMDGWLTVTYPLIGLACCPLVDMQQILS